MTFAVLFWNIWLDNQIRGAANAGILLQELKRIATLHQPDFVGLNEVLQSTHNDAAFVLDFMKQECGYDYTHFAAASPYTDDWLIGAGFCSRLPVASVEDIVISDDTPAARRGYKGQKLKAIAAKIPMGLERDLRIVVAHPMHLRLHTLRDHYDGTTNLERLVRSKDYMRNTILGGDFNEPGFMPKAFKKNVSDIMHFRTGTRLSPTWRHNGWRATPVRANLDQLYWTKDSDFTLKSFRVLDSRVSDHRPLLATFEYGA